MTPNGPHIRTLQRALEIVGSSKERLALALAIEAEALEAYLRGAKEVPHQVFIDALDIVAGSRAGRDVLSFET